MDMLRVACPRLPPDWQVTVTGHLPVLVALGTFHVQVARPEPLDCFAPRPAAWITPSAYVTLMLQRRPGPVCTVTDAWVLRLTGFRKLL